MTSLYLQAHSQELPNYRITVIVNSCRDSDGFQRRNPSRSGKALADLPGLPALPQFEGAVYGQRRKGYMSKVSLVLVLSVEILVGL